MRPRGGYSESVVEFEEVERFYSVRTVGTKLMAAGKWEARTDDYEEALAESSCPEDGQCAVVMIRGLE